MSCLEGGYNPQALARSVEAHLRVLADQPVVAGALDEVARTALRNTVAEDRPAPPDPGPVV